MELANHGLIQIKDDDALDKIKFLLLLRNHDNLLKFIFLSVLEAKNLNQLI